MSRRRNKQNAKRFSLRMQRKLAVLFLGVLLAFVLLSIRLVLINRDDGERYKKQVLSQQKYDSVVIPAKRGEIVDRNGTKIALSQKVYNVIVDAKAMNGNEGVNINPTLSALYNCDINFNIEKNDLYSFVMNNPSSQYKIVAKKQSYDAVSPIMDMLNNPSEHPDFKGVWLEDDYQRTYPYNSLACDTIGFVQGDSRGTYGLEEYYNDILTGTNGREYGYLNDDAQLERTVKPAEDGQTLVTSIDVNIQSIVEKHIQAFNDEHKGEYRTDDDGSSNTGVIIMNPNNGEVYAMASYPVFDLNDPRNIDNLKIEVEGVNPADYGIVTNLFTDNDTQTAEQNAGESDGTAADIGIVAEPDADMGILAESDGVQKSYAEAYEQAYNDAKVEALNALWKNFCINSTYEPGSTMKPFTMACGLEEGILSGNESYVCNGVMTVGDHPIHCSNRLGHGELTFSGALEQSCNIAFMKMGAAIGKTTFQKYNQIFNFGLKTNIDLSGETLTNNVVFDVSTMTPTDLAISSFGQGFNVTMIQMATGFSALINGGYYYQPHIVTKILDSDGATVETVEPRILKQVISETTSDKIKQLCENVVSEGTGKSARPAGYRIGGKTGTAEKYPRDKGNYVVSFIGFAPADDPQIVIYTVIDEPNVPSQASARYATVLTREILTEVLPYLNVFQTEELSEEEEAELEEKKLLFSSSVNENRESEENADNSEETDNPDASAQTQEGTGEGGAATNSVITFGDNNTDAETYTPPEIQYDPETGYAIDPSTGVLLDPTTGQPVDPTVSAL